jgi:hypothetical protein
MNIKAEYEYKTGQNWRVISGNHHKGYCSMGYMVYLEKKIKFLEKQIKQNIHE